MSYINSKRKTVDFCIITLLFKHYLIISPFCDGGGGVKTDPTSSFDDHATTSSSGYFVFPRGGPPSFFNYCLRRSRFLFSLANFVAKPTAVCRCSCRYSLVFFLQHN